MRFGANNKLICLWQNKKINGAGKNLKWRGKRKLKFGFMAKIKSA